MGKITSVDRRNLIKWGLLSSGLPLFAIVGHRTVFCHAGICTDGAHFVCCGADIRGSIQSMALSELCIDRRRHRESL